MNDQQRKRFENSGYEVCESISEFVEKTRPQLPKIKVADQVKLKSGGPTMTVSKVHDDNTTITCRWFDGAKLKESQLKTSMVIQEEQWNKKKTT